MKKVIILQARFTSTRLPGKVLQEVNGLTILGWMIRLSKSIKGIDEVCVAIPEGPAQDGVVAEALKHNATVVAGPEHDVLARFTLAARATSADVVMRITTDCPLADATIADELLQMLIQSDADYACNNEPFGFPHGLDCEVFTSDILELANKEAVDPYDREHVTPWIKRNTDIKKSYLHGPGGEMTSWRWTIDTPEDLEFFKAVAAGFDHAPNWHEVVEVLQRNPELHDINRASRQRS